MGRVKKVKPWLLETKYRDIADGNPLRNLGWDTVMFQLETKYRDIADGNVSNLALSVLETSPVGNQVPRYSGWKRVWTGFLAHSGLGGWKPSTAI